MSLIMQFLGAAPEPARNPSDEKWWGGPAQTSTAGVKVDADTALKISTVWACVGLLSETMGWLPLVINRWVGEDGRERARNHPLYPILHDQPNPWQTAMEFKDMLSGHVLLRGNAYAQIVPGPRGPVDQLVPIHPDRIPPGNIEKLPNGRLRYLVEQDDGAKKPFNQEDIFHLRGPSKDGITGMSVIEYAADSMGLSLAAERYGSRFFRNDSRPGGVLRTDQELKGDAAKRLKAGWEAAHSGPNQNRVAVLEQGLQWQQIGIAPEEAQFLETREFQAEDICRWFRVPPHMVGLTSKATSWGTGIEQMGIGFVIYTLMPWLTRWTQAISRDLILATDTYFADFIVEALLRGDIGSRYTAYATGRQWGWLSVNDVRRLENMNPVGPRGNRYLEPLNMGEAGALPAGNQGPGDGGQGPGANGQHATIPSVDSPIGEHYWLLALEAAGRVVRKEIAAMSKAAQRCGDDEAAWGQAVRDFYSNHAAFVAQVMRMDADMAQTYVNTQIHLLLAHGPAAMEDWPEVRVRDLVELAIGEG